RRSTPRPAECTTACPAPASAGTGRPRLEVGNEAPGTLLVSGCDQSLFAELAFPLGGLPLEEVLLPALGARQLARPRRPDPLGSAPLRLDLRHGVPRARLSAASG